MKKKTKQKLIRALVLLLIIAFIAFLAILAKKGFDKFIELEKEKVAHQWHLRKTIEEIPLTRVEEPRNFPLKMPDYEGIGVNFEKQKNSFYITEVVIGSPAEKAGIKIGDRIISVDGKYTLGLSLYEISDLMMGEKGTKVVVDLYRDSFGENSKKFEIIREPIDISANRAFYEFYKTGKGGEVLGNNYLAYNGIVFYAPESYSDYDSDPYKSKTPLDMKADGVETFNGNDCWQDPKLEPDDDLDSEYKNEVIRSKSMPEEECVNFAKNSEKVFRNKQEIEGADPATFELLEERSEVKYSKDKNHVYYLNQKIKGADPVSFEIIEKGYAKDKNNVYYLSNKLEDSDSATFEIISPVYSKDKNNVYLEQHKIYGADPETFEVTKKERVAKDANYYYLGARKVDYEEFIKELEEKENSIY